METSCKRCDATLRPEDRYCPVCGLPQLTFSAETTVVGIGEQFGTNAVGSGSGAGFGSDTGIAWRPALRCAVLLAIPAGVLCSGLTSIGQSLGLIWMVGAAVAAVVLYARSTPAGWLSTGSGARIGLVTGLLAGWFTLAVDGISLWITRFALHQGPQMDSSWLADVDRSLQLSQQMTVQMGMTAAEAANSTQMSRAWMLSSQGRAGIAVSTLVAGMLLLAFFATIGGAMGARFFGQSRRPNS